MLLKCDLGSKHWRATEIREHLHYRTEMGFKVEQQQIFMGFQRKKVKIILPSLKKERHYLLSVSHLPVLTHKNLFPPLRSVVTDMLIVCQSIIKWQHWSVFVRERLFLPPITSSNNQGNNFFFKCQMNAELEIGSKNMLLCAFWMYLWHF